MDNFILLDDQFVPELNARTWRLRHRQSGAEVLSLSSDDAHKAFAITFRTPARDNTGIAHVLEHVVLNGSRKYPVKNPFAELHKGSLNSFVNAVTFADKTVYMVAGQNRQDFYNAVDVLLDAVFYPLLQPYHLAQEGWHYELDELEAPLVYRGVVFNEMKGVYSSPDMLLYRSSTHSLFPDTVYGYDSGGDPESIPQLFYPALKQFHATYYHPGNARIYFWGDDPPEQRLRLLDDYLKAFQQRSVSAPIPLQRPFAHPRRLIYPFGVMDEAAANKGFVQVNWAMPEALALADRLTWMILSHALLSASASPLRKALLDAGIGEEMTFGSGIDLQKRQLTFAVGMKGVPLERLNDFEPLVRQILAKLATGGLDDDLIAGAINTIEFNMRENNTGRFPRGLNLLFRSLASWLYDQDPIQPLRYEQLLTAVKERLAQKPRTFAALIDSDLLQNPHCATVIFTPDTDYFPKQARREQEKLAQARAAMATEALTEVINKSRQLKERQQSPDSPEALAAVPHLSLADLDKEITPTPQLVGRVGESVVLYHDLFTNGIIYLELAFNLRLLPWDLLPYASLWGQALLEMGTAQEDYVALARRIAQTTGGIEATTLLSSHYGRAEESVHLLLRGKVVQEGAGHLLAILGDILLTTEWDNPDRLRQIVQTTIARKESGLVPAGNHYVNRRLRARLTRADWVNERLNGLEALFFLRRLLQEIDTDWPAVRQKYQTIHKLLVNGVHVVSSVTADKNDWPRFQLPLADFLYALPTAGAEPVPWTAPLPTGSEVIAIPAQVNYVGRGVSLYHESSGHGSNLVVAHYLNTAWLRKQVREQGGAYGCFSSIDRYGGTMTFVSYRDPNLQATLDAYVGSADFLRSLALNDDELNKSIIGTIGAMDTYRLPDARGHTAMRHYLTGVDNDNLQQLRDEILATTAADFQALGNQLAAVMPEATTMIMGGAGGVTAFAQAQSPPLEIIRL